MPAYDDTTGMMSSAPGALGALNVPAGDQQGLLALLQQLQSGQPTEDAARSARTMGLLHAALGVLGHSYTPYGHSGMEGVAQGLGQGLTGYQGELDRQKALVADKFKYASLASELQKRIALQQAVKDAQGGDPGKVANLKTLYAQFDPTEAAKQALAPPVLHAISKGGSLVGPQGIVATAPGLPTDLTFEQRKELAAPGLAIAQGRLDLARQAASNPQGSKNAPPKGYIFDIDTDTGKPRLNPDGTPKIVQPSTQGLGIRGEQMMLRIQGGASQAIADIRNLSELPTSASAGWMGGRTQGPSLFAAGREALTNTMTPQEVQDHNTSVTGIQRNLAAIESAGLMPSGALTHQMDAVTFKEGDTYLTKLRKMATMSQIVDKGLDPYVNSTRLPDEAKVYMKRLQEEVRQVVPYTVHDVNELTRKQNANPGMTMAGLAASHHLAKPVTGDWHGATPSGLKYKVLP